MALPTSGGILISAQRLEELCGVDGLSLGVTGQAGWDLWKGLLGKVCGSTSSAGPRPENTPEAMGLRKIFPGSHRGPRLCRPCPHLLSCPDSCLPLCVTRGTPPYHLLVLCFGWCILESAPLACDSRPCLHWLWSCFSASIYPPPSFTVFLPHSQDHWPS